MRKTMWKAAVLFAGAVCVLPFTGCGKVTPESLARSVVENLARVESVEMNMAVDLVMNIEPGDLYSDLEDTEIDLGMDMDMKSTVSPLAAHAKGTVNLSVMGMGVDQESEVYLVEEDGEMVTYIEIYGQWFRMATESDNNDILNLYFYESVANGELKAELADELTDVDGRKAYVLHTDLTGDILEDFMGSSMQSIDLSEALEDYGIDWDDIKTKVRIYIYKDSRMPAKVKLDCKDLMNALMAAGAGGSGTGVNLKKFRVAMTYEDFDSVRKIRLPSEVRESAIDQDMNSIFDGLDDETDSWDDAYGWGDAEDWDGYEELMPDADGNYTIYSEGRAQFAVITLMDGQEFSFGSEDYLVSNQSALWESEYVDYTYSFYEYYTLEEIARDRGDCSWMEAYNEYFNIVPGQVKEMTVNGMKIYWLKNTYDYGSSQTTQLAELYGWTQVGDVIFEIEIDNYGSTGIRLTADETLLKEAFEKVRFDQLI